MTAKFQAMFSGHYSDGIPADEFDGVVAAFQSSFVRDPLFATATDREMTVVC